MAKSTYEQKFGVRFNLALVTNFRFAEACYPYAREGDEVSLWDHDWLSLKMSECKILLSEIRNTGGDD